MVIIVQDPAQYLKTAGILSYTGCMDNDNIYSISESSRKVAEDNSQNQRRAQELVTIKVESITARFFLNDALWRFISGMCDLDLRDHLLPLGIKPDDWYLSEDRSIVLMADHKEFGQIKDNLKNLLLTLYRNSPEQQAPARPAEEPAVHSPPSSIPGRTV